MPKITRDQFNRQFRAVRSEDLAQPNRAQAEALRGADLNRDGTIGNSTAERDAVWRAADRFDRDGSSASVDFMHGSGFDAARAFTPGLDPLADLRAAPGQPTAPRGTAPAPAPLPSRSAPAHQGTTGLGGRVAGARFDNSESGRPLVALVQYPRSVTRSEAARDLFGPDGPPEGTRLIANRHDGHAESARSWRVVADERGQRRLEPRAFQAVMDALPEVRQNPSSVLPDHEPGLSAQSRAALEAGRPPPGAVQVARDVYLHEEGGNVYRLNTRQGAAGVEVFRPLETRQAELLRAPAARGHTEPERYARQAADVNAQFNHLTRAYLARGEGVDQAEAHASAQLSEEARMIMGAFGMAFAGARGPQRLSGALGAVEPAGVLGQQLGVLPDWGDTLKRRGHNK